MTREMWYFEHNGLRVGPFLLDELAQLAKGNLLFPSSRLIDESGQATKAIETLDFNFVRPISTSTARNGMNPPPSYTDSEEELVVAEIVPPGAQERWEKPQRDSLSLGEFAAYGLAFLLLPMICVVVSSVLYYVWRSSQPIRAQQINWLGFGVFFLHILFGCVLGAILGN